MPCIGVGDGGRGRAGRARAPPPKKKIGKNIFVQLLCKIRIKIGYFDNFSGNSHVKFGHFDNFSYIFFGQKMSCPLKLTELLRLSVKQFHLIRLKKSFGLIIR